MIGAIRCTSINSKHSLGVIVGALMVVSLAGCSTLSVRDSTKNNSARATTTSRSDSNTQQSAAIPRGAFYKDDGPGDNPPSDPAALHYVLIAHIKGFRLVVLGLFSNANFMARDSTQRLVP